MMYAVLVRFVKVEIGLTRILICFSKKKIWKTHNQVLPEIFAVQPRSCVGEKENSKFDVTMGSFDGAEICEFIGLYLLNQLSRLLPPELFGLYRRWICHFIKLPWHRNRKVKQKYQKIIPEKHAIYHVWSRHAANRFPGHHSKFMNR